MSKNNKTEKELNAENMEQPAKDEVEVEDEQTNPLTRSNVKSKESDILARKKRS